MAAMLFYSFYDALILIVQFTL